MARGSTIEIVEMRTASGSPETNLPMKAMLFSREVRGSRNVTKSSSVHQEQYFLPCYCQSFFNSVTM